MSDKTFYVSTPIYYVNGHPHIGHAYTTIAADAIARYKKNMGYDVFFATGTDEHGQKIFKAATEAGTSCQDFVDHIVGKFKELWKDLNLDYTDFIRTTEKRHVDAVKYFLNTLYDKGDIYKGDYEGWYCIPCESFFPESQLKEGKCPDCGRDVELLKEASYFFKMSKYQDWLVNYIKENNLVLPKSKQNEILSFLDNDLSDLCVSRPKHRLEWGIELPFDKDHVTYVWFDALINYVSILNFSGDKKNFDKFWPCDYHLIGKDILRPHAVFWPIMLHALGLKPPKKIFAHGWWTVEGEKMSKSKGNALDPHLLIKEFGLDSLRYFLLREVPFGGDGTFCREHVINRINNELANDLGNLVNRSVGMLYKYCDGVVPDAVKKENTNYEIDLFDVAKNVYEKLRECLDDNLDFSEALQEIWVYIRKVNQYIEFSAPWALNKESQNRKKLENVMYNIMNAISVISIFIDPFMPDTAKKIRNQLNLDEKFVVSFFSKLNDKKFIILESGNNVEKAEPLFPKIEV
ncbi:methionine--tRNA ligase [bacterium]|nr:methionine--tRNA ligase [bacterium]